MISIAYDPLEFLKEELESEETYIKVNAMHRLKVICTLIGQQRIEDELIPYLLTQIETQEDEVLYALSKVLGDIHIYLQDSQCKMLPLLEALASSEEVLIRDQAVLSLIELANYLPDYQLIHSFINSIIKLSNSEYFPAKTSACKLLVVAYPRAGSLREKLKNKIIELCQDENFIIRKTACEEIYSLCSIIEKSILINEILPILKLLSQDENEEIRIICVNSVDLVCKLLSKEEIKLLAIPIINNFQEDRSWKVRYGISVKYSDLFDSVGSEIFEVYLLQNLLNLINDSDTQIKTGALKGIYGILKKASPEKVTENIFPVIASIFQDTFTPAKVKISCIENLLKIWKASDKDFCIDSIYPLIEQSYATPNIEIKLNLLKKLHIISSLGTDFMHKNVKAVLEGFMNDMVNWRIRRKVLKCIIKITLKLGFTAFKDCFFEVFFKFLQDPVSYVRETGVTEFKKIRGLIEADWASTVLCPMLRDVYQNSSWYLHKVGIIYLLGTLEDTNANIIIYASNSPVPNIRMAVCKVVSQMVSENKDISSYRK
jgi:serine/threonine-protein phosphatase 2A regulatory subunit A